MASSNEFKLVQSTNDVVIPNWAITRLKYLFVPKAKTNDLPNHYIVTYTTSLLYLPTLSMSNG